MRPGAQVAPSRGAHRFGRFILDLDRARLRDDHSDSEVALRPKSFDLLRHLVENAGRLVSRDELMQAVWPDVFVTDDSITQCVKDVRRALGDDAKRLVRTVPKRGFIFVADVSRPAAEAQVAPGVAPASVAPAAAPAIPPVADAMTRGDGALTECPDPSRSLASEAASGVARQVVSPTAAPEAPLPAGLASPPRRPDRTAVDRSRRRVRLAAVAALLLALPLAVAALLRTGAPRADITAAVVEEPVSAPERARRLSQEGHRRAQREAGPAAWLAQRALFEQAVAADPSFAPAWIGMVFTYTNMVSNGHSLNPAEDLRAAERAAERGLALAPDAPDAHAARGSVLRVQPDRLDEALAAYSRAVSLDATQHAARANVGWLLILLGRAEEAEPYLRTALAAALPDHPFRGWWHFQLGLVDLFLGRGDHGAQHFRRSLCSATTVGCDSRTLHLAAALALGGQVDEAQRLVEEVRLRRPGMSAATQRAQPTPSRHPAYLAQREHLFSGLTLAGLP